MRAHKSLLLVSVCAMAIMRCSCQVKNPQVYRDMTGQIKTSPVNIRSELHLADPTRSKQASYSHPTLRDGIRVTFNEHSVGYGKVENMLSFLDRVALVISKPAAIISVIRFCALTITSFIMSTFIFPNNNHNYDWPKKRVHERYNPFSHITQRDVEGVIELMSRNYDELLNRAGFGDRAACRERSLCVLGDMMACDFPNLVVTAGRFAQNHLPPIDAHKNKYTRALVLGLNQTDCDLAYNTNAYECPAFKDYVKSYIYSSVKRRRDHHLKRRQ